MKLDNLTIDELLVRFVSLSERQFPLMMNDDVEKINPLIIKVHEINKELRKRGPESLLRLTKLFNHPNAQVRKNAAKYCLGVAREPALAVLRQIVKTEVNGPIALDAGMTIGLLEEGIINPT